MEGPNTAMMVRCAQTFGYIHNIGIISDEKIKRESYAALIDIKLPSLLKKGSDPGQS